MRLKIAARQSDLARLQAQTVGAALQAQHPGLEIGYSFRASLGDLNQNDPLWKMPEKGVFTEDFLADLISGQADLVVHSWKDLPTEPRAQTAIVATLPREDVRDLLLVRKESLVRQPTHLRILTSSPRRSYNLQNFFRSYLPWSIDDVEFVPVRGNIPTRMRKIFEKHNEREVDGLILAKAALDRLLTASGFADVQAQLRAWLKECQWMVLPLSCNPTAAAQGALAIEIRQDRKDLQDLLQSIHCEATFKAVSWERERLRSYGGGCHQKIGVTLLSRPYGNVEFLRGQTDAGEVLQSIRLLESQPSVGTLSRAGAQQIWPLDPKEDGLFERQAVLVDPSLENSSYLWITRETALPETWNIRPTQTVWTAGLKTWARLAARGVWVHGSAEGLGENEDPRIDILANQPVTWVKLTHSLGKDMGDKTWVSTYRLVPRTPAPDLRDKTHFFWMSSSAFDYALQLHPEIATQNHACGPGHTWAHIRQRLGTKAHVHVHLNFEDWKKTVLGVSP